MQRQSAKQVIYHPFTHTYMPIKFSTGTPTFQHIIYTSSEILDVQLKRTQIYVHRPYMREIPYENLQLSFTKQNLMVDKQIAILLHFWRTCWQSVLMLPTLLYLSQSNLNFKIGYLKSQDYLSNFKRQVRDSCPRERETSASIFQIHVFAASRSTSIFCSK